MIRKLLALSGLSVAACWFLGRGTRGCRPVNGIVGELSQDVHTAIDEIAADVKAVQERDPAATSKVEIDHLVLGPPRALAPPPGAQAA